MILREFVASLFCTMAAVGGPQLSPPSELTAILTQIAGAVQLAGPGVGGEPLASPWQVISAGVTVHLPQGAVAGIACSNRRFVRLRGPASWLLTEPACAAGQELTPGQYALIAPQGGRFRVVEGLLTLERDIRTGTDDDPLAPVIVSPRNSVLRSPRPAVSWVRMPLAVEYRVEWSGKAASYDTHLDAKDVYCAPGPDGADVCTLPWPADRPSLAPDATLFLRVAARVGIVEPWHRTDPVTVRTQKLSEAAALEVRLRQLADLGLEGAALAVAQAGVLSKAGLYGEAVEDYRRALAATPTPELQVTLADLGLAMRLFPLAESRYREALAEGGTAVRAAATFGLGRIAYSRGRYREAVCAFLQARELYAREKMAEEEMAARQAAKSAAAKSPK
jgi:hypothetical protein